MPPEVAAALAGLITTAGACLLMVCTYYFGPVKKAERRAKKVAQFEEGA